MDEVANQVDGVEVGTSTVKRGVWAALGAGDVESVPWLIGLGLGCVAVVVGVLTVDGLGREHREARGEVRAVASARADLEVEIGRASEVLERASRAGGYEAAPLVQLIHGLPPREALDVALGGLDEAAGALDQPGPAWGGAADRSFLRAEVVAAEVALESAQSEVVDREERVAAMWRQPLTATWLATGSLGSGDRSSL